MNVSILKIFLLSLVIFIYGCQDRTVLIPADILTKEEITPLLADLHVAQASLTIFEYTDTVKFTLRDYQEEILKKRNIPLNKFEASMKFYTNHPELLKEIYEEVVNELSKEQGELEKK